MDIIYPAGYYDRFDPSKNYDKMLFLAGRVLQSAEPNDMQDGILNRAKLISDVLFSDGSVIKDCQIAVDPNTGITTLGSGVLYVDGAMRGVAPATITIPITGTVQVGVYLNSIVVSELQDPTLLDPAVGVRNTAMPGAMRLQVNVAWGRAGDGSAGDFYPVYTVVDSVPLSQTPPPDISAVSQAIAAYDVESAGGFYIVSGLTLTQLPDAAAGQQYSLGEGVARVGGVEVTIPHAQRVSYAAMPDLRTVLAEPHVALGGTETITLNHGPVSGIQQVLINSQAVVAMTHGAYSGALDDLPYEPVLTIIAVNQGGTWNGTTFSGGTTFAQGTDYKLTDDQVDWSLPGAEPAAGSSYNAVVVYVAAVTPTSVTATSLQVTGAVKGSVTQISYQWCRPRIDRLCLDNKGSVYWVQGVANDTSPFAPAVPANLLEVASVLQTWTSARTITMDGIQVVPMNQIQSMQAQINDLFELVSLQALQTAVALSDPTSKLDVFCDPLTDDTLRDAGTPQTAAIYEGIMTLPMSPVTCSHVALADTATLPMNTAGTYAVIQQTLKTLCQKVNPYQSFSPIPGTAVLTPATDYWTQTISEWLSPVTEEFEQTVNLTWGWSQGAVLRSSGSSQIVVVDQTTQYVSTETLAAEFLRQIVVNFTLTGFGPGETLNSVVFDSTPVVFGAPVAGS